MLRIAMRQRRFAHLTIVKAGLEAMLSPHKCTQIVRALNGRAD
jgi:hypothetical protein